MVNAIIPVVGRWYRHLQKGETFQVIGINGGGEPVQVQLFDGNIEEIPRDEWRATPMQACAPPEDWSGPYDDVERDDAGHSEAEVEAAEEHAEAQQQAQHEAG
jgi:hypothetical protein